MFRFRYFGDMFPIGQTELLMIAVVAISAIVVALAIGRLTKWSIRRVAVIAALPIPAVGIAFAVFLYVSASMASDKECGFDACAMMAAAAFTLGILAIIAFAISFLLAGSACWLVRK